MPASRTAPLRRAGRAFLMELDPLYSDVIVQRWEQFTGRKAERISDRSNAPDMAEASEAEG